MPPADIETYLAKCPSISRYNTSFRKLYGILLQGGVPPSEATVAQVASGLLTLSKFSKSEAKNAYSAMLLFPGFQPLRFNHVVSVLKKTWKSDTPKYASFWCPEPILRGLLEATKSLNALSLPDLRLSLLLSLRLLQLCRGIDLANILRTVSFVQNRPFIRIKRKGWRTHRWEEVISLEGSPPISPWHLLQEYVARTTGQSPPGGPVYIVETPIPGLDSEYPQWTDQSGLGKVGGGPPVGSTQHKGRRGRYVQAVGVASGRSLRNWAVEKCPGLHKPLPPRGGSRKSPRKNRQVGAHSLTMAKCGARAVSDSREESRHGRKGPRGRSTST